MLNLLNLLAASSAVSAFALPKIEIRQESSPLKITHVLNVGPTCSSSEHTNVLVAKTSLPGLGATAVIDFFKGEAYAKPEGGNTSYSDCTITVDFSFPIGFHLNSVNAIANGVVDFDDGMTQAVKMDIWFPSKNDITATNETRVQGAQGISRPFDLETFYDIPKTQDFWDACYGQSQIKVRIQQNATSTAWGTGKSNASTKVQVLVINLHEGNNGGKYTSFCGAGTELGGGGAIWSGAETQAANMPKQCSGILCSLGVPSLGLGGVWTGLGISGSSFTTGP